MKPRKALFWAHLAAGLLAGGVVFSMAASGILMAFEPQLTEWSERDRRQVQAPPGARRLSLDELAGKAASATPKGRLTGVTIASDPSASAAFAFGRDGGTLYLDPYTGSVLGGESGTHRFLHAVEEWHRWFGSRDVGKPITGAACLLFSFLLLSGLCLWFPRRLTRAAFKASAVPSLRLRGKARNWNWHNAAGFWAAPLVLVTTLTGTVIAYRWASDLLFVATGNEPPPRPQEGAAARPRPQQGVPGGAMPDRREARAGGISAGRGPEAPGSGLRPETPRRAALDVFLAKVDSVAPGWAAVSLRLPQKPGGPVTAGIQMEGAPKHERSQLSMDASTGGTLKWEPYAGQNLGRRLRAWVVPLHTGRAGGPAGQFLALLSASAALLLVWTGTAMAWARWRSLRRNGGNIS